MSVEALQRLAKLERRLEQDRADREALSRRQAEQERRLDDMARRLDALDGGSSFDPAAAGLGGVPGHPGLRGGERPHA